MNALPPSGAGLGPPVSELAVNSFTFEVLGGRCASKLRVADDMDTRRGFRG